MTATFTRDQYRKRILNLTGNSSIARTISSRVSLITRECGEAWCVSYLKECNMMIQAYYSGTHYSPTLYVAKRNGFPELYANLMSLSDPNVVLKVASIYKSFVKETTEVSDTSKDVLAILSPKRESHSFIPNFEANFSFFVNSELLRLNNYELPDFFGSTYRFMNIASNFEDSGGLNLEPPVENAFSVLAGLPPSLLLGLDNWESIFSPLLPYVVHTYRDHWKYAHESDIPQHVGTIGLQQEPGLKARLFANPHKVYQCLTTPLYNYLKFYRDQLGTDCTLDQISGAYWVKDRLLEGKTLHSVDQSSATHRFPYDLQKSVMKASGVPASHIEMYSFVATGKWSFSKDIKEQFATSIGSLFPNHPRDYIQWAIGQPLGTKPSIALYGLTHNLIVRYCCFSLNKDYDCFKILGDDIVISDDGVHSMYLQILDYLGCDVSETKSYSSKTYAEFAGFKIVRDCNHKPNHLLAESVTMVRPGNFRAINNSNFIDIATQVGCDLPDELTLRQRLAVRAWWFISEPTYTPPIEEYSIYLRIASEYFSREISIARAPQHSWWFGIRQFYIDKILIPHRAQGAPYELECFKPKPSFYELETKVDTIIREILLPLPILDEKPIIDTYQYLQTVPDLMEMMIELSDYYGPKCVPTAFPLSEEECIRVKIMYLFHKVSISPLDVQLMRKDLYDRLKILKQIFLSLCWIPPKKKPKHNSVGEVVHDRILRVIKDITKDDKSILLIFSKETQYVQREI